MTGAYPDWTGGSVVIIASGPSLTVADCETVRNWRVGTPGSRVIVINTSFRMAPWADVLYACDAGWWQEYGAEARAVFGGEFWSTDAGLARPAWVNVIPSRNRPGLSMTVGLIHQGANSGYQSIGLAHQFGATRMVLLGFDMMSAPDGRQHHHADHPGALHEPLRFDDWLPKLARLAIDLRTAGVSVVNATRRTALAAFPLAPLEDALQ